MLTTTSVAVDCPTNCTCPDLQTIHCNRQHLIDVPKGIPTTVIKLQLDFNKIFSIRLDAFNNLTILQNLSIKNNLLSSLQPGIFHSLSRLHRLDLTNNKLRNIDTSVWYGLVSLRFLRLSQNQLTSVPDPVYLPVLNSLILDFNRIQSVNLSSSFTTLTDFSSLVLGNNPIKHLTFQDFQALRNSRIEKLSIAVCILLQDIESGVFSGMTSLQTLRVSYNSGLSTSSFARIISSVVDSGLILLDMSGSFQLQDSLPAHFFNGLNSLIDLKLKRTKLSKLLNDTFGYLVMLQTLDMTAGELKHCEHSAFSGLPSLQTLLLSNNQLDGIPANLPPNLTSIDLSDNPRIINVENNAFVSNHNLESLSLSKCGILRIGMQSFSGLNQLRVLILSHNRLGRTKFNIGEDLFRPMPKLRLLDISHNKLTNLTRPRIFAFAQQLTVLNMSGNNLDKFLPQLFHNLTNLQHLKLSRNTLNKMIADDQHGFIFQDLRSLQSLDLSRNNLSTMPSALFSKVLALQQLDLHGNLISHCGDGLFDNLTQLRLLNLSDNHLAVVSESSLKTLDSRGSALQLDMTVNPYDCSCDLIWFRDWLNKPNVTFIAPSSYVCASPQVMQHEPVLTFQPGWLRCRSQCIVIIITVVATAVPLIVFFVGLNRIIWKLRMYWYRFKRYFRRKKHEYNELAYEYAVMVSYVDADEDWIMVNIAFS